MSKYLLIVSNFLLAVFILYLKDKLAKYLNIYDFPNKRKFHRYPVPILGGLILFICICFNLIIQIIFKIDVSVIFNSTFQELLFLIILASIFFVGLYDDKFQIEPYKRLISLAFFFLIFITVYPNYIVNNLNFSYLDLNLNLKYFSIFFTVLCFLLFLNASNMIDGINGFAIIYFIIFFIYLLSKVSFSISLLNFIIVFLFLCLFLNLKNKTFLGDSGIYVLSFTLTVFVINFYKNSLISIEEIFCLMIVPGIDMFRLFVLRLKQGKNPFEADTNHLHHYVLKKVKNDNYTLFISLIITFLPIVVFNFIILSFNG